MNCLFCKMVSGEIAVPRLYEDDKVIVIKDKFPQAPVHCLAIPKKHYGSLNEVPESELGLVSHLFSVIRKMASEQKIAESGYRTVFNTNKEGGQSVLHLHLHLLGGQQLGGSMTGL